MVEKIINGVIVWSGVLLILAPFGIWKLVEVVIWMCRHVKIM